MSALSEASEIGALSAEFGPFHGRVWMNCAHQGPLPRCAQRAALEAIELKRTPARLQDALFAEVPARLRAALARLTTAPPEQIALTNSTSYGFNLLAQGLPWRAGDEVLCPALARELEARGIDIALRDGKLRFSPHLHNSPADVDRVLEALHELA